ncbi:MAG: hypothetical protein Q7U13_06595 [Rhodoferax sp.]|nr:hypothetical protein [Rhodoferax sp.]
MRTACLAAASAVALVLGGCGSGSSSSTSPVPLDIIEANLDAQAAQIGGATTAVAYYDDGTTKWTLYSMANRFAATPIGTAKGAVSEITVPGYIQHITKVTYNGTPYALLSMGGSGIGVVNISNPAALVYSHTMTVNYDTPSYPYVDGGGTEFTAAAASHTLGPVNDVLVDNNNTPADYTDDQLFIANGAFGIQKTKLSNLMAGATNGAVAIDGAVKWTLKYAGENPWGGPLSLKMAGGKLYAALGFLGMGIYNPADLTRTGFYNLYTDTSTREDWFGFQNQKPSDPGVLNVPALDGLDADGMLTYKEAGYELKNKSTVTTFPWASFDRYGKYYYNARTMDVQVIGGKTMAFIAYSLGGLVAVDVTNPAAPVYVGYVAAAPAHGPDEPTGQQARSILSHFGSGMLKEAGVMDVSVVVDPGNAAKYQAYYTDHFAGLVVVSGAEDPATKWKNAGAPFNNDTKPEKFWPDYEFVKSYDMTPVPVGDESMPKYLTADTSGNYTAPVMLVTGELNGHGGALFMMPSAVRNTTAAGQVDLVQASGGGGVSLVDIKDVTTAGVTVANRFGVPVQLVSTNEVGAYESGAAGQPIAIGHAEGVAVSGNYLYLADGPHGMSAWRIADGAGPTDNLHLVANTLQSEYPTGTVLPAPHAFTVAFGSDPTKAYVMSQSLGVRRVDVSAVTGGTAQVGTPALLNVLASGIYEHSSETGGNLGGINGQDHAYGVTFSGKYAIVADGGNGLTVYDTTVDATTGQHVVANIGGTTTGLPPLGRTASVKLWTDPATSKIYAVVAAGSYGISVVDMTAFLASGQASDLTISKLIKTFEPIKSDADNALGSADGKSVDVHVVGDYAYFSYDSFGLVAYRMADLIQPPTVINPLCTDPTKLSTKHNGPAECRPAEAGRFKLQLQPGYETVDGGALYMTPQYFPANQPLRNAAGTVYTLDKPKLLFYVAYGAAGVVKLDWSDPAKPVMMAIKDTVGSASATAIANGRVYVSDGTGGLVVFK